MLYSFLRFRHAADIAWLAMRLYDSREPGDLTTEARIGYTIEAVLYFQHLNGGITIGPDLIAQEAMPDVAVHERVFLIFDTLMGMIDIYRRITYSHMFYQRFSGNMLMRSRLRSNKVRNDPIESEKSSASRGRRPACGGLGLWRTVPSVCASSSRRRTLRND